MYKKNSHVHFVGIGGIGMSGIAKILKLQGYTVSGCDADLEQKSVEDLKNIGCSIYKGNNTPSCHDTTIDVLVYSSAIQTKNPEIAAAQERGIPTIQRAFMLAELMRTKFSIAISGAHGKTTTTSLISHIMLEAEMDPTVVIGGHLKNISSNAHYGSSDYLVAEADESDRSLLNLQACLAIVTNIDMEHLDIYTDLDDIKNTFITFLKKLPFYGKAIVCIDDANIRSILPIHNLQTITYGIDHPADLYARDITLNADHSLFTVYSKEQATPLGTVYLNMPGKHNVLNSLAAIALTRELNVPFAIIANALKSFKGIDRRFTFKGTYKGAEIFDDYGHHPQEIECTLLVAKRRAKKKLTVVFQPHRFTRTQKLWDQFVNTFINSGIDHLIITDIFPASEAPIPDITSANLAKAIQEKNPHFTLSYIPFEADFKEIKKQLEPLVAEDDLVLLLGAGKVNKLADKLS